MKKFLKLIGIIAVIIISYFSYTKLVPYGRVNPEKIDITTDALLDDLESYAARPDKSILPTGNDLHFDLALFYVHIGQYEKAEKHLKQVSSLRDKRDHLQPYTGMILDAVTRKNSVKVLEILSDNKGIVEKNDPNAKRPSHVNETLCSFAAKAFASMGDYDNLKRLESIPACRVFTKTFLRYHLAALLTKGQYKEAYALLTGRRDILLAPPNNHREHVWQYIPGLSIVRNCFPDNSASDLQSAAEEASYFIELQKSLQTGNNDIEKYLVADFLRRLKQNDSAFELSQSIADPFLRKSSILAIYESYYLANNRTATLAAAKSMGLDDASPEGDNSGGMGHAQWYARSNSEVNVLLKQPSPLAYEIAMRFKNGKTRFKTLLSLYAAFKEKGVKDATGCETTALDCVKRELNVAADAESDEQSRDYMYSRLQQIESSEGNTEAATTLFKKIKDPNRMICHYDMCSGSLAVAPISGDAECDDPLPDDGQDRIYKLLPCHFASKKYQKYMNSPSLLSGAVREIYFRGLSNMFEQKHQYKEMLDAAANIGNEAKSIEAALVWAHVMPMAPWDNENEQRAENRNQYMQALYSHPYFGSNVTFWEKMWSQLEYSISKLDEFSSLLVDADILRQQHHEEQLWALGKEIVKKAPAVRNSQFTEPPCKPSLASSTPSDGCLIKMVRQGRYKEALALASIESYPRVQRAVLFDRFMRENQSFRDGINSGYRFHYISENSGSVCPISPR